MAESARYGGYKYKGERLDELKPNSLATDREPWKQQDGEPMLWYNRFRKFYLLDDSGRSPAKAYGQSRRKRGNTKLVVTISNAWRYYIIKYSWKRRAIAFDDYMFDRLQNRVEDERYQAILRQRKQSREWAEAGMAWLRSTPEHRIVSGVLALRAWRVGTDVEMRSLIPPQILRLLEMSDAELQQGYEAILTAAIDAGRSTEAAKRDEDRPSEDVGDDPPNDDSAD